MSRKQVIILWVLALVLAGSAFYVKTHAGNSHESKTARHAGQKLFENFPAREVARIQITEGKNTAGLVRKDGKWLVADRGGYPANMNSVNEFLRQLADVKVVEGVEAQPSFAPRFGMDSASTNKDEQGTEVVFTNDAGKELARVTFGKTLKSGDGPDMGMMGMSGGAVGRFIRNDSDSTGVYKVKEMFPSLTGSPSAWLDQQFLTIEKINSITVSQPGKADTAWKLSRPTENDEFALEGKQATETLDGSATGPLKSLFSTSTIEDVVTPDRIPTLEDPSGKRSIEVTTVEGFDYKITLSPTKPIKAEGEIQADPDNSYLMTVDVSATIPAERKKGDKESEADAKAKDAAFAERKATLEKRLADQKAFAGRTFKVSTWTVEALVKDRDALLKKPAAAGAQGRGLQSLQELPPGLQGLSGGTPPPAVRRPVEATTPPVAVPPPAEDDGDGDEDGH